MPRVRSKPWPDQPPMVAPPAPERAGVTVAMIQALIPLGLRAVEEALLAEVDVLAGPLCARGDDRPHVVRWGRSRARSTSPIRSSPCRCRACEMRPLQERRLDDAEWLVLVPDGKKFAGGQLVVALGVTATGEKRLLGLVQTGSQSKRVLASFLRDLGERGFPIDQPLLAVLDGAKGLRTAVREMFGDVPVPRCQWRKRENVVSYLAKYERPMWRRKLQAAYAHATHAAAHRALTRLHHELRLRNLSTSLRHPVGGNS